MNTEETLRDALQDEAQGAAAPATWDGVRTRGRTIARRRRAAQGAAALVSVAGIVIGVLAAAGTFSGGGDTRDTVIATPPGAVANEIVVTLLDRVEVISADDGHVIRTIAPGVETHGGVTVTPDGKSVLFSHESASMCAPELVQMPVTARGGRILVGHATDPLVSPDGEWVAYVANDSCAADTPAGDVLGLTNLRTGANYRPDETQLLVHASKIDLMGWSPGSDRLVYNEFRDFGDGTDQKSFILSGLPFGENTTPVPIPIVGTASAATFLPDGRLLAALPAGNAYDIVELDASGNTVGKRFHADGPSPSALALDPSGTRLLVTLPDGTLLVQEGTGDPRVVAHGVQGAAWLPAEASPT